MKHIPSDDKHLLVLKRGEDLVEVLNEFAAEQNLNSAWLSGLGGAAGLTIGFYDIEVKDYEWQSYDQPLEILSLTGNLAIVDGEPFWHIHGVFSDRDCKAIGGHVKSLTVGLTCEINITELPVKVSRQYDPETGLKLIYQEPESS